MKLLTSATIFLLFLGLASVSYSQVPQSEREALIAFYNSTNGDTWTNNTGWNGAAGTECDWYGVGCFSGNVGSIILYDNSLTGSIPAELGNLTNLTTLYLYRNSLSGSIPAELGNLTNLWFLHLNNNSLSGGIPAELGNLTNLTTLYLDNNSLSGSIPTELGNLMNLTTLYLQNNSLSGSIPAELGNLTNLWFLHLNNNSLSGSIPTELGNLTNLADLFLSYNSLSGSIPVELGNLTNLTTLNLGWNDLTGSIPVELSNLTNLTGLYLDGNSLSGSIPAELGNLTNLWFLHLNRNSLSGSIPVELGNLTNFTTDGLELDLNDNKFSRPKPAWLNSFTSFGDSAFEPDSDQDGIDDSIDTNYNSVAMIKRIIEPDYSLSILGSGRVVNLVSTSLFNETSGAYPYSAITQITKILYSHLKDEFDFIMIAANNEECCSDAGYYGAFFTAQNDITGLGMSIDNATASYGSSGKLQGVIHFPYLYGLTGGPGLHEIAHNWGNDLIKTEDSAHWGYSNVGGQLGGWQPNSLVTLDDGTYQAKGPLDREPGGTPPFSGWTSYANGGNSVPYSNLELYIMGMIGAEEVGHDIKIAEDFNWTDSSNGIFEASSITTLTMDQIIADKGIRDPNHLNSQKNFRAMYVVVSEDPMTREEWRSIDKAIYEFQLEGDNGDSHYNFWEATQGKGTMSFDQIDSFLTTVASTFDPSNQDPVVNISSGNRTIPDTDNAAGESVSFTGTATDSDGTIATTEWLVGGSVVATGLNPSISLPNGSTVVTFKATDNEGDSSTTTATITVATPTYTVTDEWPSPYNGVTPDSSLGLAFNNIGIFSTDDATIYTCLRVFTDGLPGSVGGIGEFDIGLTIVSLDEGTVQVTKYREFNVIGALNENIELPDCSGKFETTTGIYTDIIEAGDSVLETTFSLTDSSNLILTLQSYETITAPN